MSVGARGLNRGGFDRAAADFLSGCGGFFGRMGGRILKEVLRKC